MGADEFKRTKNDVKHELSTILITFIYVVPL